MHVLIFHIFTVALLIDALLLLTISEITHIIWSAKFFQQREEVHDNLVNWIDLTWLGLMIQTSHCCINWTNISQHSRLTWVGLINLTVPLFVLNFNLFYSLFFPYISSFSFSPACAVPYINWLWLYPTDVYTTYYS